MRKLLVPVLAPALFAGFVMIESAVFVKAHGQGPALGDSGEFSEGLRDGAFDRYTDLRLLGEAIVSGNAALAADVALQLAEGERVLLRAHKAVPAEVALKLAVRLAAQNRDGETLDRLAKAVKSRGNQELVVLIEIAQKTAKAARKVDPGLVLSVDETTPEAFVVFKSVLDEIKQAKLLGDREGLDQLAKGLAMMTELHDKQRAYLTKMIGEARSTLPEKSDPMEEVLRQLANASRAATAQSPIVVRYEYDLAVADFFSESTYGIFGSTNYVVAVVRNEGRQKFPGGRDVVFSRKVTSYESTPLGRGPDKISNQQLGYGTVPTLAPGASSRVKIAVPGNIYRESYQNPFTPQITVISSYSNYKATLSVNSRDTNRGNDYKEGLSR